MNMQRTGGMTAIGILNIVLGAIGSLLSLLVVLGGGLLAAGGAAASSSGDTSGAGGAMAAGGGLIAIMGLVGLACWGMMCFSGIGVLKLAPWGRTLSMVCGGFIAALMVLSMVTSGTFSIMNTLFMCYGAMLVYMCMRPEWKQAFSGQSSSGMHGDSMMSSSENMRRAA